MCSGKAWIGTARLGGRGVLRRGMVWYGKAVLVSSGALRLGGLRHGGRVELWSGKMGCGEAVQVCWGLVSWVTAYQGEAV